MASEMSEDKREAAEALEQRLQLEIFERKKAEEALVKSESFLEALFNQGTVGFAIISPEKRWLRVNRRLAEILGYPAQELLNKTWAEMVHPEDIEANSIQFSRMLKGEIEAHELDSRFMRKDGAVVLTRFTVSCVRNPDGSARFFTASLRARRQQSRAALQEERNKLNSILDSMQSGVTIHDRDHNLLYQNDLLTKRYGNMVGQKCHKVFQDRDSVCPDCQVDLAFEDGRSHTALRRFTTASGKVLFWDNVASPIRDANGNIAACVEIATDATEREQAAEALIASQHFSQRLQDSIPSLIYVYDLSEHRNVYANREVLDYLGYTVEEIQAMGSSLFANILHPDDAETVARHHARLATASDKDVVEIVYRIKNSSGEWRWLRSLDVAFARNDEGTVTQILGTTEDITERKQAEEQIHSMALMVDSAPNSITVHDFEGRFLYANQKTFELHGYSRGEFMALNLRQLDVPASEKLIAARMQELRERGEAFFEAAHCRKDGTTLPLEVSVKAITWDGKNALLSIATDSTERKLAGAALRESEEKLQLIFDSATDGIVFLGLDGKVQQVNQAVVKMFRGVCKDEFIGRPAITFIAERDRQLATENMSKLLSRGANTSEYNAVAMDGSELSARFSSSVVRGASGSPVGFVSIIQDVTERRRQEEEHLRADRLDSIGTLAGGIAHDFNNMLTGIMGNISLARMYSEPGGKADAMLAEAEKASIRARDLTQQLLTFSRGGAPVKKPANLGGLVREAATFASRGSRARCDFSLPDDLWAVEADEGQINQVISNLVINACEAMPDGGAINLVAANRTITEKSGLPLPPGKYIEIRVQDRGIGISAEHLKKVFDPYFTTKKRGSGLGLTTTYNIVKNHGGHISADSILGAGTTFRLYLPATEEQPPVMKAALGETAPSMKSRILVMDDEEPVRVVLGGMIPLLGHEAVLTRDGAEAVSAYSRDMNTSHPFDLVILDLTVPGGTGGKEAIKKLLEIDPKVKAIVCSGYANDPIIADYRKYGFSDVVTKPFRVADLRAALKRVLSTP